MHEISKLMDNLIKFGHSKIFIPTRNPNENYVMYFYMGIDSNLYMDEGKWIFNEPYWDGYEVNEKAYAKKMLMTTSFASYKELTSFIATIIVTSIHNYGIYQVADEVYDLNDNDKTLSIVYNFIMAALDIPNSLLYKMLELEESDIVAELIKTGFINYKSLPYSKDLAPKLINKKMDDVLNRLYYIEGIIKADEKCLPSHTKKLLNKMIKNIEKDDSMRKINHKNYR